MYEAAVLVGVLVLVAVLGWVLGRKPYQNEVRRDEEEPETKEIQPMGSGKAYDRRIAVVNFWHPQCHACHHFAPTWRKVEAARPDVAFVKVNVANDPETAQDFKVRGLPLTVVIVDSEEAYRHEGLMSEKELTRVVDSYRRKAPVKAA